MLEKKRDIKEIFKNEEIKLTDLLHLIIEKRKVFFVSVVFTVFLGLVKSCTTPVEYESVSIMLSEVGEEGGKMGQLGGLAGLAGINLSGMTGAGMTNSFSPELYPKLLESKPFLLSLIKEEFYFESKKKKMSLEDYYLQERPNDFLSKTFEFVIGVPYLILSIFEPSEMEVEAIDIVGSNEDKKKYIYISPDENFVISEIKKRIKIENKGRIITLTVKMPEALISAEFNVLVFNRILDFVSAYKIEKQKNNLLFIEQSTKEAEENFKKAQLNLASFRDANQGIISQRARTREEQLDAEFNLAFQLYSTLKQELENSKIELKKETPIFTTFEEAVVPNAPSNSSPVKILIISIFVGSFLGLIFIFLLIGRDFIRTN